MTEHVPGVSGEDMDARPKTRLGDESSSDALFAGPGEMRARFRTLDWSRTALGPADGWPAALRAAARLMLASPVATSLWCGATYTLLYNDAYQRILGVKHPDALGHSGAEVWNELWPILEPQFAGVRSGEGVVFEEESLLPMDRLEGGAREDAWFTYALSPLNDEDGSCLAVYNVAVEITEKVRAREALVAASAQLQDQQMELELSNQQLQDNAVELEAQTAELQASAAELEERTLEAEEARRAAEEARARVTGILEQMADAHFALDSEFRIVAVNGAMERGSGLSRAELLGRSFWEMFPGALGTDFERNYRRTAGEGVETHFTHDYSDGRLDLVVDVDAYPAAGGGIAVFWRDVTARMQTEAERERLLRESEALRAEADTARSRLADLFRRAPAFIAVVRGRDHVFELVNERYYQLVGRRDILGKPVLEALPEVRGQGFTELLDRVLDTGEPFIGDELPVRLARTAGAAPEERFVNFVYQALTEADGTRSGVFVHGIDVTESVRARKEVEETAAALMASEARYRSLAEAVPVQVWTARPDGELNFVSDRTAAYFGVSARALLGSGWGRFVHPDDLAASLARWRHSIETGTPYETEFRLRAAEGEYRWHLARALPEHGPDGTPAGWVGSNTDVEAERRARGEAEKANRAKSEFLASMSHELRTPINAILGYTDLLEGGIVGPVTERQRQHLGRIVASGRHLVTLVEDILDLAKLDAGRMEVVRERGLVYGVVAAALPLVQPQAAAKRITIEDRCTSDCEYTYVGDEDRIRQILVNLLSNAVKFTEPGGHITVEAEMADTPDERTHLAGPGPWACIRVTDTGVGIAPDQMEAVFQPFVQVESGHTRTKGGTGLGLTISRDFARLMGGDLIARSTFGEGTSFTVWLPAVAAPAEARPPEGVALAGVTIQEELDGIMADYVSRLRADPLVPEAHSAIRIDLEDHIASFLADLAQSLVILGETGGKTDLMRDGSDVQRLISERHGGQRARLHWDEAALRREYHLLREELARRIRRAFTASDAAAEKSIEAMESMLTHAENIAVGGFHAGYGPDPLLDRTRSTIETTRRTIGRAKRALTRFRGRAPGSGKPRDQD